MRIRVPSLRFALLLLTTATLAGCVAAIPPVEVTRFHRFDAASPVAPGRYRVQQAPASGAIAGATTLPDNFGWQTYAAAVSRQMDLNGFAAATESGAGGSGAMPPAPYSVSVAVDRYVRNAAVRPSSPVSVGVGGSTGSYGSGVGVGVGVNLNSLFGHGGGDVIVTRLSVRILRNGDALPVWEGRAETAARDGTPAAQPGLAADKLATALFRGFPGRSGETITVP